MPGKRQNRKPNSSHVHSLDYRVSIHVLPFPQPPELGPVQLAPPRLNRPALRRTRRPPELARDLGWDRDVSAAGSPRPSWGQTELPGSELNASDASHKPQMSSRVHSPGGSCSGTPGICPQDLTQRQSTLTGTPPIKTCPHPPQDPNRLVCTPIQTPPQALWGPQYILRPSRLAPTQETL